LDCFFNGHNDICYNNSEPVETCSNYLKEKFISFRCILQDNF